MIEIIHLIKGYLGYEVLCEVRNEYETDKEVYFEASLDTLISDSDIYEMDFKLKLRPIEDLTDEELWEAYRINKATGVEIPDKYMLQRVKNIIKYENLLSQTQEYFHKNHIDYQDLIGQGLAIKKEKI